MLSRYHYQIYSYHILSIVGLVVWPSLVWLLLPLCFLIFHIVQIIMHDYICHEYIKPRNSIIEILCLLIWCLFVGERIADKKTYHFFHHRNWKNNQTDPTQLKLKNNNYIKYIFDLYKPTWAPADQLENPSLSTHIFMWFNRNCYSIFWAGVVISFVLLPIKIFFIFHILSRSLFVLMGNSHDYYFHKTSANRDSNWLSILLGSAAWHMQHHETWKNEYYGPGQWRYLNFSWYLRKLFFKKA